MKYIYKEYNPNYVNWAQQEIRFLKKNIPNSQIVHFGSTAIPGIGGKGIIDIYIAVNVNQIKTTRNILKNLNYEFKKSGSISNEHWFFQQNKIIPENKNIQRFHIHLTHYNNQDFQQCIDFCKYLCEHPFDARRYDEIKHKAANSAKMFSNKIEKKKAYMNVKEQIIQEIIQKMYSD